MNVIHMANQEGFLTKNQKERWNSIIEKVPQLNRVYLEAGLKQLKEVMLKYNDWI